MLSMFPLNPSRALAVLAVGATVAVTTACGGSGSGYGDDAPTSPTTTPPSTTSAATVQATPQLTFTPREVAVRAGGTVTWAFGTVAHNVTFGAQAGGGGGEYGGGSTASNPSNVPTTANASVARTFGAAGTYGYECTIHPGMRGAVTVR